MNGARQCIGLVLLGPVCLSAQQLSVYFNTNDCINCTAALGELDRLDSTIAVTIYCDQEKQRFIPEVLGRFGISGHSKCQVVYIPSLQLTKKAPVFSECLFIVARREVFHFALKDYGGFVKPMNSLARPFDRQQKLPLRDTLRISDRVDFHSDQGTVFMSDYLTGRSFMGRLATDSVRVEEVRMQESLKRNYLASIGKDTLRYDSLEGELKKDGVFEPVVSSVNAYGDTLFLLFQIRYPDRDSTDVLDIVYRDYPAFVALRGGDVLGIRRWNWLLPEQYHSYLTSHIGGFAIRPEAIVMPMVKISEDKQPTFLLGAWQRERASSVFNHLLDIECPRIVLEQGPENHFFASTMVGDLYIMKPYPFFYDLGSATGYDLGPVIAGSARAAFFRDRKPLFWTMDARWMGKSNLEVLYSYQGGTWVAWIDVVKKQLLRKVKIDTRGMVEGSVVLVDDGRVLGVSKNYDAFIILQ